MSRQTISANASADICLHTHTQIRVVCVCVWQGVLRQVPCNNQFEMAPQTNRDRERESERKTERGSRAANEQSFAIFNFANSYEKRMRITNNEYIYEYVNEYNWLCQHLGWLKCTNAQLQQSEQEEHKFLRLVCQAALAISHHYNLKTDLQKVKVYLW